MFSTQKNVLVFLLHETLVLMSNLCLHLNILLHKQEGASKYELTN